MNARLPKPLAEHVSRMVGSDGLFETPSEYIRALIRKDMESEASQIYASILEGFEETVEGRYFESTGNWKKDKELMREKKAKGWSQANG